jgi:hypothetical protein
MNHLDVGFDGIDPIVGFAVNVMNKYFDEYFPRAIRLGKELENDKSGKTFIYTTHPWLVSMYTDCPSLNGLPGQGSLHCPNNTALKEFEDGIRKGFIAWHVFPFNAEPEYLNARLFKDSLSIARDLDAKYGRNKTIVMSQRDVPGMTSSVIKILKDSGVKAITVGVNSGSAPPAVPKAFLWSPSTRNPEHSESILTLYHPGGYGGYTVDDAVIIPDLNHALVSAFRGDNKGPPESVAEILQNYKDVQTEFPNAKVVASTFDRFVNEFLPYQKNLPTINSEIGDTWIHGIASDPFKNKLFRAILRARDYCFENNECKLDDQRIKDFDRLLVKAAEHTWGLDVKTFLHDWENWSNLAFGQVMNDPNFVLLRDSWKEQRHFIYFAIDALQNHPLVSLISKEVIQLLPKEPNLAGFTRVKKFVNELFECGRFNIAFGPHGGLSYLNDKVSGVDWVPITTTNYSAAQFVYTTFSEQDFINYIDQYGYCDWRTDCPWFELDFAKPNCTSKGGAKHFEWTTKAEQFYYKETKESWIFNIYLTTGGDSILNFGAPERSWMTVTIPKNGTSIKFLFQMFNKTPTRLPEALWMSFKPRITNPEATFIDKLGQWVSPIDVVKNGSQHLHGHWDGVKFTNTAAKNTMHIRTPDVPLLSIGTTNPFPVPFTPASVTDGVHFCIYNNIWATKYVPVNLLQFDSNLSTATSCGTLTSRKMQTSCSGSNWNSRVELTRVK